MEHTRGFQTAVTIKCDNDYCGECRFQAREAAMGHCNLFNKTLSIDASPVVLFRCSECFEEEQWARAARQHKLIVIK